MPEATTWGAILEGVEEAPTTYEDIPEGKYKVRLEAGKPTKSSKDTEGLNLTFRIIEGPYANRVIYTTYWISASPAGLKLFFRNLKELGVDRSWLANEDPSHEQVIASIINQDADVTVKHNRNGDYLNYNVYIDKGYGVSDAPVGPTVAGGLPSGPSLPSAPAVPSAPAGGGLPAGPPAAPPVAGDPWATAATVADPPSDRPF